MEKEDWVIYSVTLFTFAVIFFLCYIRHVFTFFDRNRMITASHPTFPFGNMFPVISGNIPMFMQLWKFYNKIKRKKGKIGGFYVFLKPAVIVTESSVIKTILSKNQRFQYFGNSYDFREHLSDKCMLYISNTVRSVWSKILSRFENEEVNFSQIMSNDFIEMSIEELFSSITHHSWVKETLSKNKNDTSSFKKLLFISHFKSGVCTNKTKNRLEKIIQSRKEKNDILQVLVDDNFSCDEMSEFVYNLVQILKISSNLLLFILYELIHNKEIDNDLRGEIQRFTKNRISINHKEINEMTYLETVICETLRKYPVTPFIYQVCRENFSVNDINIDEGLLLFISTFGIHHDSQNYINPELFDPDRFSEESEKFIDPFKYLPFGCETKDNFGLLFLKLLMKLTLTELLTKIKFSPGKKTIKSIQFDEVLFDTLKFKYDLWVKLAA